MRSDSEKEAHFPLTYTSISTGSEQFKDMVTFHFSLCLPWHTDTVSNKCHLKIVCDEISSQIASSKMKKKGEISREMNAKQLTVSQSK